MVIDAIAELVQVAFLQSVSILGPSQLCEIVYCCTIVCFCCLVFWNAAWARQYENYFRKTQCEWLDQPQVWLIMSVLEPTKTNNRQLSTVSWDRRPLTTKLVMKYLATCLNCRVGRRIETKGTRQGSTACVSNNKSVHQKVNIQYSVLPRKVWILQKDSPQYHALPCPAHVPDVYTVFCSTYFSTWFHHWWYDSEKLVIKLYGASKTQEMSE